MLITRVCEKEGCSGNKFYVNTEDKKLKIKCVECGSIYNFQENMRYIVAPTCIKCDYEQFKINRDNKNGELYINCVQCNNPPRKVYTDDNGTQVSYDQLVLVEIKNAVDELKEKMNLLGDRL
jgi:hypothetical protein